MNKCLNAAAIPCVHILANAIVAMAKNNPMPSIRNPKPVQMSFWANSGAAMVVENNAKPQAIQARETQAMESTRQNTTINKATKQMIAANARGTATGEAQIPKMIIQITVVLFRIPPFSF